MPDRFAGLWILNGYPQLQNYQRKVDYQRNTEKPVLFYSQNDDKVVPYEFLLTEFRRQRLINGRTIFRLFQGKHELKTYSGTAVRDALTFLTQSGNYVFANSKDSIWIFPPLDAYILDSNCIESYTFRTKIGKRYGMKNSERAASLPVKQSAGQGLRVLPRYISRTELSAETVSFEVIADGKSIVFSCKNYLLESAW